MKAIRNGMFEAKAMAEEVKSRHETIPPPATPVPNKFSIDTLRQRLESSRKKGSALIFGFVRENGQYCPFCKIAGDVNRTRVSSLGS
jgi:hypothetical protein